MFPLSCEDEIPLAVLMPEDVDKLLTKIEEALSRKSVAYTRQGNKISFKSSFWGYWFWHFRAQPEIDGGEIEVISGRPGAVNYNFYIRNPLIWLLPILLFAGIIFLTPNEPGALKKWMVFGILILVMLALRKLTSMQLRRFIQETIDQV